MSNETKRNMLKKALNFFVMCGLRQSINYDFERHQYLSDYDAALPDDLPVIPESVGGLIKVQKARCLPLSNVLGAIYNLDILRQEPSSIVLVWVKNNEDTFARAWVLGVWCVEENGEIVKLEAER